MPVVDMPLEELEQYRPTLTPPADLRDVWDRTLTQARRHRPVISVERVDAGLPLVDVDDVTFAGSDGQPVRAWWIRPAGATQELPVVVEYLGYGGGRGLPLERLVWATAGYAHLVMDTRGQGSSWSGGGHTPDLGVAGGPAQPGFMTRGVLDIETFYYRRLVTDAVRAVDAARELPGADVSRVVVAGVSQGGGLALAAAGLSEGLAGAVVDVPFLCHVRRGVEIATSDPYREVARYLAVHREHVEQVFATFGYVDGVHLGALATAPALFSVAMEDVVCPPSTVYAAFHAYGGPAEIEVYPFNGHEGGQSHQQARALRWVAERVR